MNNLEHSLAKGLCLQLILAKGLSFEYERPTIEEAKRLTASYRPWHVQLSSRLFFNNALEKVDWDAVIDTAISPETILEVYNDCLEERRKKENA